MKPVFSPSRAFIEEVERTFSIAYPPAFHAFCERYEAADILSDYPQLPRGKFIDDIPGLVAANVEIGSGTWGDYEMAIAGKYHPKDGTRFWDNVLPIYIDETDYYGFDIKKLPSDVVVVWSVHTTVHEFPSMASWLGALPSP